MKRIKVILISLIATCSLTSCAVLELMAGPDYDLLMHYNPFKNARRVVDTLKMGSEVIIFPMEPYAKPHHLAEFKKYLDYKKSQGFVVFYETIDTMDRSLGENLTAEQIDTLRRKTRRVLGYAFDAPRAWYNDKIGKQYYRNHFDLMTWRDSLGLTTEKDHHIDCSVKQLVDYYEANVKPIVLTEVDFTTPLNSAKYQPSDTIRHIGHYLLHEPRESHIIDEFESSTEKKFIFVYSHDIDGYLIDRLFDCGYRSDYGFNANKEYEYCKKLSEN